MHYAREAELGMIQLPTNDDTTCVYWVSGFDAHDVCQCSCGTPGLVGVDSFPTQLRGKLTEEAFTAAVAQLNAVANKYWPPGRMRAPVYTVFPFWFLFILTSSSHNSGFVTYIYPIFFLMILISITCQLGTVCWHYPTVDIEMVRLCQQLTADHPQARFRFFSLTAGGRSSAFYKAIIIEARNRPQMVTISCEIPPSVRPGDQMLVNTDDGRVITIVVPAHAQSGSTIQMQVPQAVRRSEPRRVEPPARPLPNLPNMPSIGQRPPSTDAATGMMMVMAQPVQSEPGPVTQPHTHVAIEFSTDPLGDGGMRGSGDYGDYVPEIGPPLAMSRGGGGGGGGGGGALPGDAITITMPLDDDDGTPAVLQETVANPLAAAGVDAPPHPPARPAVFESEDGAPAADVTIAMPVDALLEAAVPAAPARVPESTSAAAGPNEGPSPAAGSTAFGGPVDDFV